MHRYGNRKGQIHFDDFMMCAVKLKTMIGTYVSEQMSNYRDVILNLKSNFLKLNNIIKRFDKALFCGFANLKLKKKHWCK